MCDVLYLRDQALCVLKCVGIAQDTRVYQTPLAECDSVHTAKTLFPSNNSRQESVDIFVKHT
jgi:hypothetical protein